jgi:hypothetical protein
MAIGAGVVVATLSHDGDVFGLTRKEAKKKGIKRTVTFSYAHKKDEIAKLEKEVCRRIGAIPKVHRLPPALRSFLFSQRWRTMHCVIMTPFTRHS